MGTQHGICPGPSLLIQVEEDWNIYLESKTVVDKVTYTNQDVCAMEPSVYCIPLEPMSLVEKVSLSHMWVVP